MSTTNEEDRKVTVALDYLDKEIEELRAVAKTFDLRLRPILPQNSMPEVSVMSGVRSCDSQLGKKLEELRINVQGVRETIQTYVNTIEI
jgi:hypothetical protein